MLKISNLSVSVDNKQILKGIDLEVKAGEVHAIMGPNGSGKSTLANVLAGRDGYQLDEGRVLYNGRDLLSMPAEVRAREGVFVAFQYPVEIPGVNMVYFIKAAVNAKRKHQGLPEYDAMEFMQIVNDKARLVKMDEKLLAKTAGACRQRRFFGRREKA